MKREKNNKFGTRAGFILATAGAAIGLGNVQRFPYMVAQEGGASFVMLYLLAIILFGLPLILAEFSIGRFTKKNPVGAIDSLFPNSKWRVIGAVAILTAFFILSYYSVVGGWTLSYIIQMLFQIEPNITTFNQSALKVIGFQALFLVFVMLIVFQGVKEGIERYSKIFMPILFIILLVLVIRSLSLPGSLEGVKYYLMPDFSKISARTIIMALGQAFFSLSIGEAVLITYGSYTKKKENLVSSAGYIVLFDTVIALLAGLMIFPALFAFGQSPDGGVDLVFMVLPKIFLQMPLGFLFGAIFFILLAFAAITTGIALLEMPVVYLIQQKNWSRKKAVVVMGILCFLVGIPSALSQGANSLLTKLHLRFMDLTGFYSLMDFFFGNLGMIFGGFSLSLFIGWIWNPKIAAKELSVGSNHFPYYQPIWIPTIRYIAPIIILIIFFYLFW